MGANSFFFFILYVDNILLDTHNVGLLHETNKYISENFEIKVWERQPM